MQDETGKVTVVKISESDRVETEDLVANEAFLTIVVDNEELVTLICSPSNVKELAIGYLASEGLITGRQDIERITHNNITGVVHVDTREGVRFGEESPFKRLITSGCGKGVSFYNAIDAQSFGKVDSIVTVSYSEVYDLMKEFLHKSSVHSTTGGVHSAALCNHNEIIFFHDDIGRHNAIDKVLGRLILEGVSSDGCFLITTGRLSSEILFKVIRRNIPIVLSKSAPTVSGIKLAIASNVTLVGFVRGKRMNVYSNDWRIT